MLKNEKEINKINSYLGNLRSTANSYYDSLSKVQRVYQKYLEMLESVLNRTTNWYYFTDAEQQNTETLVMLVGILNEMCKVKLVNQSSNKGGLNTVNTTDVNAAKKKADDFLNEMAA
jgi:S-formylglutathione hydrolase FrmB